MFWVEIVLLRSCHRVGALTLRRRGWLSLRVISPNPTSTSNRCKSLFSEEPGVRKRRGGRTRSTTKDGPFSYCLLPWIVTLPHSSRPNVPVRQWSSERLGSCRSSEQPWTECLYD